MIKKMLCDDDDDCYSADFDLQVIDSPPHCIETGILNKQGEMIYRFQAKNKGLGFLAEIDDVDSDIDFYYDTQPYELEE